MVLLWFADFTCTISSKYILKMTRLLVEVGKQSRNHQVKILEDLEYGSELEEDDQICKEQLTSLWLL